MGCAIAIDLGSNTLRLIALECKSGKVLYEYEKVIRTAEKLTRNGHIGNEAIRRIIEGIERVKQEIDLSKCPLRAVATEALRRAKNAKEVIERIFRATGIRFEVIDPSQEASLTLSAVKNRLDILHFSASSFVLVDIGGGSTEVVAYFEGEIVLKSFPIGIVTVASAFDTPEAIEEGLEEMMLPLRRYVGELYATKGKPQAFVATAGTPTTIAAMKLGMNYRTYDAKKINGTGLQKNELRVFLNKLLGMDEKEREATVGVGRSDLILAGIVIFEKLFSLLDFERCVVVDDGLREGVALQLCRGSGSAGYK